MTMPYNQFADSFIEFSKLNALVHNLRYYESSHKNSTLEAKIIWECDQIKIAAKRDIPFFVEHAHIYVQKCMMNTNYMIIHLQDRKSFLRNQLYMTVETEYLYRMYTTVLEMIKELRVFFNQLGRLEIQ